MKISHTCLLSQSRQRFKMNLWWTHSFCKVPWKKQQRRHREYTFVCPLCVCVHVACQSQESVSSTLWTFPSHAHFDSDSSVPLCFGLSGVCVNVTKVEMWTTLGVFLLQHTKTSQEISAYLILFFMLLKKNKQRYGSTFNLLGIFLP